jgi:cysteine desulfurase
MNATRRRVYLDYNGSTPLHPAVRSAMLPWLRRGFGNPSSGHWAATPGREALGRARSQIAGLLGCTADEVVFTSGGTEADNAALLGAFYATVAASPAGDTRAARRHSTAVDAAGRARGAPHFISTAIEHPAIIEPLRFLERLGATVTLVGVDSSGLVDPDDVARAVRPTTVLVSVMHANNEVGTVQPIAEIARVTREADILLHTDAAQSVGKLATRVDELGVDLLSIAGHKLYAPKGIGALYIRTGVSLEPFLHGAGHEAGRRAGTESVLLDVGLGAAAELAADLSWTDHVRVLRDRLWQGLRNDYGDRVLLNGHPVQRLPNTLNVSFLGHRGADILVRMPSVAATTGSACHTGGVTLSPVLAAMGVTTEAGAGAVRFSLGRMTTGADIDVVLLRLRRAIGGGHRAAGGP